jgi:zinc resistance-associated protein
MMGPLTPEQAGQHFDQRLKFLNDTADLRKQMAIKQAELAALWRVDSPDEKQLLAKKKEMNALRDQLQEKSLAFRLQARKTAPPAGMGRSCPMGMGPGAGCGMGCGMGCGGPMGMGMSMGRGMMMGHLTPAQAGDLFDLRQKFLNDTAGLRKQMVIKGAELGALWRTDSPDEKQLLAKKKEMNALRDQMQEKSVAFRLQARKIAPWPAGGRMSSPMGLEPGAGHEMNMAMCDLDGSALDQ